jgi:hypothetical protein
LRFSTTYIHETQYTQKHEMGDSCSEHEGEEVGNWPWSLGEPLGFFNILLGVDENYSIIEVIKE